MSSLPSIVCPPSGGEVIKAFGDTLQVKLNAASTGGLLSMGVLTTPSRGGPPLHRHIREDELFTIIEGRYRFVCDGQESEAGPGTVVFLPRGSVHTFQVVSDTPGKAWLQLFPSGFESFFRASALIFEAAGSGPPDMDAIMAAAAAQGIEILGPPLS